MQRTRRLADLELVVNIHHTCRAREATSMARGSRYIPAANKEYSGASGLLLVNPARHVFPMDIFTQLEKLWYIDRRWRKYGQRTCPRRRRVGHP